MSCSKNWYLFQASHLSSFLFLFVDYPIKLHWTYKIKLILLRIFSIFSLFHNSKKKILTSKIRSQSFIITIQQFIQQLRHVLLFDHSKAKMDEQETEIKKKNKNKDKQLKSNSPLIF